MTWTEIPRPQYRRDRVRYASDTTDKEWAVIGAGAKACRPGGLPMAHSEGFSPVQHGATVFLPMARRWHLGEAINHVLVMLERERQGREVRCRRCQRLCGWRS